MNGFYYTSSEEFDFFKRKVFTPKTVVLKQQRKEMYDNDITNLIIMQIRFIAPHD